MTRTLDEHARPRTASACPAEFEPPCRLLDAVAGARRQLARRRASRAARLRGRRRGHRAVRAGHRRGIALRTSPPRAPCSTRAYASWRWRTTTAGCATSVRPASSIARGAVRGVDWHFNAWGGLNGGLYFPWDQDDLVARKVLEIEAPGALPRAADQRRRCDPRRRGGHRARDRGVPAQSATATPSSRASRSSAVCGAYLGVSRVIWLGTGRVQRRDRRAHR